MPTELELGFNFRNRRFKRAETGLHAFALSLGIPFRRIGPKARQELRDILDTVALAMDQRHSTPWSRTAPRGPRGIRAGKLYVRRGGLMRSLAASVRVRGNKLQNLEGEIGGPPTPDWAWVHERGAVIKTKRAKYLTIPLPAALTSRGVPKKLNARAWRNTFVAKSKAGNLLIFQKRGKNIVPLYFLKKRVRIPKRVGLEATLQKATPVFVDRLFDALVKEMVAATGGAAKPTA